MLVAGFVCAAVSEGYLAKVAVVFSTDITVEPPNYCDLRANVADGDRITGANILFFLIQDIN